MVKLFRDMLPGKSCITPPKSRSPIWISCFLFCVAVLPNCLGGGSHLSPLQQKIWSFEPRFGIELVIPEDLSTLSGSQAITVQFNLPVFPLGSLLRSSPRVAAQVLRKYQPFYIIDRMSNKRFAAIAYWTTSSIFKYFPRKEWPSGSKLKIVWNNRLRSISGQRLSRCDPWLQKLDGVEIEIPLEPLEIESVTSEILNKSTDGVWTTLRNYPECETVDGETMCPFEIPADAEIKLSLPKAHTLAELRQWDHLTLQSMCGREKIPLTFHHCKKEEFPEISPYYFALRQHIYSFDNDPESYGFCAASAARRLCYELSTCVIVRLAKALRTGIEYRFVYKEHSTCPDVIEFSKKVRGLYPFELNEGFRAPAYDVDSQFYMVNLPHGLQDQTPETVKNIESVWYFKIGHTIKKLAAKLIHPAFVSVRIDDDDVLHCDGGELIMDPGCTRIYDGAGQLARKSSVRFNVFKPKSDNTVHLFDSENAYSTIFDKVPRILTLPFLYNSDAAKKYNCLKNAFGYITPIADMLHRDPVRALKQTPVNLNYPDKFFSPITTRLSKKIRFRERIPETHLERYQFRTSESSCLGGKELLKSAVYYLATPVFRKYINFTFLRVFKFIVSSEDFHRVVVQVTDVRTGQGVPDAKVQLFARTNSESQQESEVLELEECSCRTNDIGVYQTKLTIDRQRIKNASYTFLVTKGSEISITERANIFDVLREQSSNLIGGVIKAKDVLVSMSADRGLYEPGEVLTATGYIMSYDCEPKHVSEEYENLNPLCTVHERLNTAPDMVVLLFKFLVDKIPEAGEPDEPEEPIYRAVATNFFGRFIFDFEIPENAKPSNYSTFAASVLVARSEHDKQAILRCFNDLRDDHKCKEHFENMSTEIKTKFEAVEIKFKELPTALLTTNEARPIVGLSERVNISGKITTLTERTLQDHEVKVWLKAHLYRPGMEITTSQEGVELTFENGYLIVYQSVQTNCDGIFHSFIDISQWCVSGENRFGQYTRRDLLNLYVTAEVSTLGLLGETLKSQYKYFTIAEYPFELSPLSLSISPILPGVPFKASVEARPLPGVEEELPAATTTRFFLLKAKDNLIEKVKWAYNEYEKLNVENAISQLGVYRGVSFQCSKYLAFVGDSEKPDFSKIRQLFDIDLLESCNNRFECVSRFPADQSQYILLATMSSIYNNRKYYRAQCILSGAVVQTLDIEQRFNIDITPLKALYNPGEEVHVSFVNPYDKLSSILPLVSGSKRFFRLAFFWILKGQIKPIVKHISCSDVQFHHQEIKLSLGELPRECDRDQCQVKAIFTPPFSEKILPLFRRVNFKEVSNRFINAENLNISKYGPFEATSSFAVNVKTTNVFEVAKEAIEVITTRGCGNCDVSVFAPKEVVTLKVLVDKFQLRDQRTLERLNLSQYNIKAQVLGVVVDKAVYKAKEYEQINPQNDFFKHERNISVSDVDFSSIAYWSEDIYRGLLERYTTAVQDNKFLRWRLKYKISSTWISSQFLDYSTIFEPSLTRWGSKFFPYALINYNYIRQLFYYYRNRFGDDAESVPLAFDAASAGAIAEGYVETRKDFKKLVKLLDFDLTHEDGKIISGETQFRMPDNLSTFTIRAVVQVIATRISHYSGSDYPSNLPAKFDHQSFSDRFGESDLFGEYHDRDPGCGDHYPWPPRPTPCPPTPCPPTPCPPRPCPPYPVPHGNSFIFFNSFFKDIISRTKISIRANLPSHLELDEVSEFGVVVEVGERTLEKLLGLNSPPKFEITACYPEDKLKYLGERGTPVLRIVQKTIHHEVYFPFQAIAMGEVEVTFRLKLLNQIYDYFFEVTIPTGVVDSVAGTFEIVQNMPTVQVATFRTLPSDTDLQKPDHGHCYENKKIIIKEAISIPPIFTELKNSISFDTWVGYSGSLQNAIVKIVEPYKNNEKVRRAATAVFTLMSDFIVRDIDWSFPNLRNYAAQAKIDIRRFFHQDRYPQFGMKMFAYEHECPEKMQEYYGEGKWNHNLNLDLTAYKVLTAQNMDTSQLVTAIRVEVVQLLQELHRELASQCVDHSRVSELYETFMKVYWFLGTKSEVLQGIDNLPRPGAILKHIYVYDLKEKDAETWRFVCYNRLWSLLTLSRWKFFANKSIFQVCTRLLRNDVVSEGRYSWLAHPINGQAYSCSQLARALALFYTRPELLENPGFQRIFTGMTLDQRDYCLQESEYAQVYVVLFNMWKFDRQEGRVIDRQQIQAVLKKDNNFSCRERWGGAFKPLRLYARFRSHDRFEDFTVPIPDWLSHYKGVMDIEATTFGQRIRYALSASFVPKLKYIAPFYNGVLVTKYVRPFDAATQQCVDKEFRYITSGDTVCISIEVTIKADLKDVHIRDLIPGDFEYFANAELEAALLPARLCKQYYTTTEVVWTCPVIPGGVHHYNYLAVAGKPGIYNLPAATVYLEKAPEVGGVSSGGVNVLAVLTEEKYKEAMEREWDPYRHYGVCRPPVWLVEKVIRGCARDCPEGHTCNVLKGECQPIGLSDTPDA